MPSIVPGAVIVFFFLFSKIKVIYLFIFGLWLVEVSGSGMELMLQQ